MPASGLYAGVPQDELARGPRKLNSLQGIRKPSLTTTTTRATRAAQEAPCSSICQDRVTCWILRAHNIHLRTASVVCRSFESAQRAKGPATGWSADVDALPSPKCSYNYTRFGRCGNNDAGHGGSVHYGSASCYHEPGRLHSD